MKLWKNKNIQFHQWQVNSFLTRFWPDYPEPELLRVFVPCCGKSLDMLWLAQRGHQVVGVELSPIAVKAFFKQHQLRPEIKNIGDFSLWQCNNISIFCGDFFKLTKALLGEVHMVFDKAALTALSSPIRKRYASYMTTLIPHQADIFLLTIEDFSSRLEREQAADIDQELPLIFKDYSIRLQHVEDETGKDVPANGLAQAKLYRLKHPLFSIDP
ncbi:thiopurine S-methyltransferase [Agarivorans sp. QJM3NY_25]|uniref:thiopurine S-methyltransferase n=2 Tax=Agarivorans TaxID=261825 RepID=UPI003D7EC5CC